MSQDEILFDVQGEAGVVTLNRPKALNALNHAMCIALRHQLEEWAAADAINVVIIRGAGTRAFCSGGDIRALYERGRAKDPQVFDFFRDEYRLNAFIHHFPKPYVALLDGITMGGGVGISIHGSHRVVTENTVLAMPETGIGFFPDVGATYFLPRCPGGLGLFLGLTGTRIGAADALVAGLGSHAVKSADLDQLVVDLAAGGAPDDVLKGLAFDPEPSRLAEKRRDIDFHFAKRSVDEIVDTLTASEDPWAEEIGLLLRGKSPTSLKVVYRQICEGAGLDIDAALRLEFRLVHRFFAGHDFFEGVRATIIDKDQQPQWWPQRLEEIGQAAVDAYFAPLGPDELALP